MKTFIPLFLLLSLLSGSVLAADKPTGPAAGRRFKIIQTQEPVYPSSLKMEGVRSGVARVALHVDEKGQLVDSLVVACSRRAFGDEVQRIVKLWKFEPEYRDGEPVHSVVELTMHFEVNGIMVVSRYGLELNFVGHESDYEYQACTLKKLDAIPTPITIVQPVYYEEWATKGIVGDVTVDFYIDETGKVRFPVALAGADALLADISVEAVRKWQFAPPTRKGEPVLVHVQQVFSFGKNRPVAR